MSDVCRPEKYPPGRHPNSIANLIPYKPGENGHKGGYSLKEKLRHALNHPIIKPTKDACAGDHVVYATLQGAVEREPTPFKELWDRIEGKQKDTEGGYQDNRVINIVVSSEAAKELTQGVARRLIEPRSQENMSHKPPQSP